jgi:hypothetical protein
VLDKEIVKYYIGYVSLICRFIATQNYKSSWDLHQQKQVGLDTWQPELVSLPGTDPWSLGLTLTCEPAKFELCQGTWDQQTVHRARRREGRPWTDPLWSNWSWTLCATRVRVKPGETYRQPQVVIRPCGLDVNSHKQQAPSHTTCGCVDNCKKEFDSW